MGVDGMEGDANEPVPSVAQAWSCPTVGHVEGAVKVASTQGTDTLCV